MGRGRSTKPPSYRLHKPTGQAVVTIRGKDHYLGRHGSTESLEAYHRLCGEWLAEAMPATPAAPRARKTVGQVAGLYWQHALAYYKGASRTGEKSLIRAAIKPLVKLYGSTWADEFGPLKLRAVREDMLLQRVNGEPISRHYANKLVDRVRRLFKWAGSLEHVPAAVYESLRTVDGLRKGRSSARETAPITGVDDAIVDLTLPHMRATVADIVRIQRITGMRPGEVCMLRPMDVDRSKDVWLYVPREHKTEHRGRVRIIPIGPKGQAILLPYLARPGAAPCFSPAEDYEQRMESLRAGRKTKVQPSQADRGKQGAKRRPGTEYTALSLRNAVYRACDRAWPHPLMKEAAKDLTAAQRKELRLWRRRHHWHPNQLRHSRATEIRKQFGLEEAQVVLGHAKADVTQLYTDRDVERAMAVARETG